jgi:AraC-like DNA-binding protein
LLSNDRDKEPGFPFDIGEFQYGQKLVHKDARYRIMYIIEGKVVCKKGEGFTLFNQHGFIVIPPLSMSGIRCNDQCRGYEITIGPHLFDDLKAKVWDRGIVTFPEDDVSIFSFDEQEMAQFTFIMETLAAEWKEKRAGFKDIIRLKLIELCIGLSRINNREPPLPGREKEEGNDPDIRTGAKKIDDILIYLQDSYHEPLSLDTLAAETGFSTSYLSRYFKEKTGMCLFEYINRLRVKRACFLLKHTDKKIIEIAYDVGYNNVSFFNRYFKKTMGTSPVEYRKKTRL